MERASVVHYDSRGFGAYGCLLRIILIDSAGRNLEIRAAIGNSACAKTKIWMHSKRATPIKFYSKRRSIN